MPEFRPCNDVPRVDRTARTHGILDGMLVGLVLFTLARSGDVLAGEQAPIVKPLDPTPGIFGRLPPALTLPTTLTSTFSIPGIFDTPPALDLPAFSNTEFRPRKHTVFDADPAVYAYSDTPMLRGTTVWQRLSEYKSRDRVRLLTLWESTGSTVSLQAGKRGDPSLQWTSRAMNRGGSTLGLFDQWFSLSLAHAGNSVRGMVRPASLPAATPKSDPAPVAAGLK
jgi:hypothetical protein